MLEVFEEIKGKKYRQQIILLNAACKVYPLLPKLLKIYVVDQDRVITPMKIMKMMRYYRAERSDDINRLGEIGDFAASRMALLKRKEFGWDSNINHLVIEMKDVKILIDSYEKLKIDVRHKNQYRIMKNCFVLISPLDIKWFVRMLCRKIEMSKALAECIKENELTEEIENDRTI